MTLDGLPVVIDPYLADGVKLVIVADGASMPLPEGWAEWDEMSQFGWAMSVPGASLHVNHNGYRKLIEFSDLLGSLERGMRRVTG